MRTAYERFFPSLYRGIVEKNIDPENLGRCRVRVPAIHGKLNYSVDSLPWARPISNYPIKEGRGNVIIPDKGDIVWVLFEGGDRNFPIYFGGTYARGDLPIDNNIVEFYVENDTKFSYNRETSTYTISMGDTRFILSPEGVSIVGNTSIEGNLNIDGDMSVTGLTTLSKLIIIESCNRES